MEEQNKPDNYIYPNGLTRNQIIRRIVDVYHAGYDLTNHNFDVYEQLLVCESIAETMASGPQSSSDIPQENKQETNGNVSANGNGNGGCKNEVNLQLKESKLQAISKLKTCKTTTSPFIVEKLLTDLFSSPNTLPGHWLYTAQIYTPRVINRVINAMIKSHRFGSVTIRDSAAYFTLSIKFRAKRKLPKIRRKKHE